MQIVAESRALGLRPLDHARYTPGDGRASRSPIVPGDALIDRISWIQRTFEFPFAAGVWPEVIEPLCGTPVRFDERVRSIAPAALVRRDDGRWSILEDAGLVRTFAAVPA